MASYIKKLDKVIGQERLINTLKIMVISSKKQKKQLEHILLHGPPGLGKTTCANMIAKEYDANVHFVSGPLLSKKSDIITLLASLQEGDFIFIDEIHGMNNNIEEMLYSALEEFVIDILIGPEGDQKIMRMKLPKFTMIAATTLFNKLKKPLKDRFGFVGKFIHYTNEEIGKIIKSHAVSENVEIDDAAVEQIATVSKGVPRVAKNTFNRVLDFMHYKRAKKITLHITKKSLDQMGIYEYGTNEHHIKYLKELYKGFEYKWVSINVLSNLLNENKQYLINEIEPILLSKSLITKGSRGRRITQEGVEFISKLQH